MGLDENVSLRLLITYGDFSLTAISFYRRNQHMCVDANNPKW